MIWNRKIEKDKFMDKLPIKYEILKEIIIDV